MWLVFLNDNARGSECGYVQDHGVPKSGDEKKVEF